MNVHEVINRIWLIAQINMHNLYSRTTYTSIPKFMGRTQTIIIIIIMFKKIRIRMIHFI